MSVRIPITRGILFVNNAQKASHFFLLHNNIVYKRYQYCLMASGFVVCSAFGDPGRQESCPMETLRLKEESLAWAQWQEILNQCKQVCNHHYIVSTMATFHTLNCPPLYVFVCFSAAVSLWTRRSVRRGAPCTTAGAARPSSRRRAGCGRDISTRTPAMHTCPGRSSATPGPVTSPRVSLSYVLPYS